MHFGSSLQTQSASLSVRKTKVLVDSAILALYISFASVVWAEEEAEPAALPTPVPNEVEVISFESANKLIAERKWSEAVAALRSVLGRDPDRLDVRLRLIEAMVFGSQTREAFELLSQTLESLSSSSKEFAALREKGRYLGSLFFHHEASQAFEQARISIEDRKFSESIGHLNKALGTEPSSPLILVRLGQVELSTGDTTSAAAHLKQATGLLPVAGEGWLWRARAEHQTNQKEAADQSYAKAWQNGIRGDRYWAWRSELWADQGETQRAIRSLEDQMEREPLSPLSMLQLARVYSRPTEEPSPVRMRSLLRSKQVLQLAISRSDEVSIGVEDPPYGFAIETKEDLKKQAEEMLAEVDRRIEQLREEEADT
jgi:tetratricopeptide (TPR) repeat protein